MKILIVRQNFTNDALVLGRGVVVLTDCGKIIYSHAGQAICFLGP